MITQRLGAQELQRQLAVFGQTLKDSYERAGVSKRQLAAAASLDRAAITRIEQGERAPKFDKLLLLADAAKTTPAALLAGIGPQEPTRRLRLAMQEQHSDKPSSDDNDPVRRFAANLRWVRERAEPGLTQEGLALEAEIDRSSPNGYETGRMAPPTVRTILKLAGGLGIGPSLLVEDIERCLKSNEPALQSTTVPDTCLHRQR
ncbi:MAG: helix-turn-helix domain-containing protein [Solirubrobacteraceae bacterium]